MIDLETIAKDKSKFFTTVFLTLLAATILSTSIGFSALNQNLNIAGDIEFEEDNNLLYNVLKKESEIGTYAKEFTGAHNDSFTEEPTKSIYHWIVPGDSTGNSIAELILDKNNVIFANHCWQMFRTTDTGGVKMIYNGEAENGKCLNTRGNHVGYNSMSTTSLSQTYYYGTSYSYDKNNNVFSLDGTITTGSINKGQYTCKTTDQSETCSTLYYVDNQSSGTTYYVIALNGAQHYSQFGKLQFNYETISLAKVGYMYNTEYKSEKKRYSEEKTLLNYISFSDASTYYFADSYEYSLGWKYTLVDPSIPNTNDYSSLIGKYTIKSSNIDDWNNTVYLIVDITSDSLVCLSLSSGNAPTYYQIQYGNDYTDNGDGTYTVNNPTTLYYSDYYQNYSSLKNKYACFNTSNTCNKLYYVYSTTATRYNCVNSDNMFIFSNSFNYNEVTGNYELNNDNIKLFEINKQTSQNELRSHHYTCLNNTGICSTIYYVNYIPNTYGDYYLNYLKLSDGKSIEDAIDEMINNNDINAYNSTIKTGLDAWYKRYLNNYTNKIEDIVFCNYRKLNNLGGLNPANGYVGINGSVTYFDQKYADLSCLYDKDSFSTSNNIAKLDYPIGLATRSDLAILNGGNIIYGEGIRKTGMEYWINSAYTYQYNVDVDCVGASGRFSGSCITNNPYGVRPVISLKPETEYTSGDGSMEKPYLIDTYN